MKTRLIPVILFLIFFRPDQAWAGTISLDLRAVCRQSGQEAWVEVTAANNGDEAAREVNLTLYFRGEAASLGSWSRLPPGSSYSTQAPLRLENGAPGDHAVLILADFHDAHGHPYSAWSYGLVHNQRPCGSLIQARLERLELEGEGRLKLGLTNPERKAHQVKITLVSPRELGPFLSQKQVFLKAGEAGETGFEISSSAANPGAEYTVLVLVEYDSAGLHCVSVAETRIRVLEEKKFFKTHRTLGLILITVLALAVILIEILKPGGSRGS
ncbi:MAG: hypothetical protein AB1641_13710 [Thermodesulfobacteriota bacterium]